ncbi:MAG: tRNA (guanosine(46)-N7)-methyltransferase TrmB [Wenzhouxiangellaceae bacterium]|nr:tRNA (guanosine(46)-N7)-methyltransferase TrmB [Wenzhouxiangellaceae bacterium]
MYEPADNPRHRRVRSFVRRPGRLTPAQQRALEQLLPRFEVKPENPDRASPDLRAQFERNAALVVEIGFGNGEALAWMASNEPHKNFIGIEVHEPGVGRLLRRIDELELDNVRVGMCDAVELLRTQARPGSIDEIRIFFPDPWPKKRHHKRRLIQAAFIELLARVLKPGGRLHLATDWQPYADWMREQLDPQPLFRHDHNPVARPAWRPETHFEKRGLGKGHAISDLLYYRTADPESS